jgi:hypothetical protein
MSKKATIGISPKDSSMDKMDRYIKRNEAREAARYRRHGASKKNKPFDEWPMKDRIAYYENMTPEQKFDNKYKSYSSWFNAVRKEMEEFVYPAFFMDCVNKIKPELQKMFEDKMQIKEAVNHLKTVHKIY